MGFRLLVLNDSAELSCHSGYLVVHKEDEIKRVHLSEIDALIMENPQVRLTGKLINNLMDENIAVLLCNDKHAPMTLFQSIRGHHRRSLQIKKQIIWTEEQKAKTWKFIVSDKIRNQRHVLFFEDKIEELLFNYEQNVELDDITNREAMAAKVYFHRLFGESFVRHTENSINWALNYGYSLLLMYVTRTINGKGHLTELGIKHNNEYNAYNLSCDIMEPFRPIIDFIVCKKVDKEFDLEHRRYLQQFSNMKVIIDGKTQFVPQAIEIYVQKILNAMNANEGYPIVELDLTPIATYEF